MREFCSVISVLLFCTTVYCTCSSYRTSTSCWWIIVARMSLSMFFDWNFFTIGIWDFCIFVLAHFKRRTLRRSLTVKFRQSTSSARKCLFITRPWMCVEHINIVCTRWKQKKNVFIVFCTFIPRANSVAAEAWPRLDAGIVCLFSSARQNAYLRKRKCKEIFQSELQV